jgi:hypothetical protein
MECNKYFMRYSEINEALKSEMAKDRPVPVIGTIVRLNNYNFIVAAFCKDREFRGLHQTIICERDDASGFVIVHVPHNSSLDAYVLSLTGEYEIVGQTCPAFIARRLREAAAEAIGGVFTWGLGRNLAEIAHPARGR